TPYEAAFKRKPNMANVPDWGAQVFVLKKSKSKLDVRARVGRWVGNNDGVEDFEVSQGHRIYWPDTRSVTVERSVVFRKEEGEIRGFLEVGDGDVEIEGEGSELGNNPNIPTSMPITNSPSSPQNPLSPQSPGDPSLESVRVPRVRKPSQYVQRLVNGDGTTGETKGILPRGMSLPN
ncbi:hypothetical protein BT96DRAFT_758589, partial [Gymnopus androsaceus JB14]